MKKVIFSALLLMISLEALASPEKMGFYPIHNDAGGCSGTLISKKGHFLTARHCVENILIQFNYLLDSSNDFEILTNHLGPDGMFKRTDYHRDLIEKQFVFDNSSDREATYSKARIYAIGPGVLYPRFADEEKTQVDRLRHQALASKGYSEGGDFVILRLPELSNRECKKIVSRQPINGEPIKSFAFTCDAVSQVRSGKITSYSSVDKTLLAFDFFAPNGTIVTTSNSQECNSGSAFLDSNGSVIGILNGGISGGSEKRSFGLSMNRILQLMGPVKSAELIKLNQACK